MGKTVGIDAGDFEVRIVELDGSYKKTRLSRVRVAPIPVGEAGDADPAIVADVVAETMREGKISGTPVLGHPCRDAVLRTIDLPFRGDAIRKVIKAEVEGVIHSHTVDDMVVDYHEIGPGIEGTKVLVAAVPKPSLRPVLQELERNKIEPEHVDLDTMALFRAAEWCGVFEADEGEQGKGGEAADAPVVSALGLGKTAVPVTVVLDLAERSTRILLVEGENLVDMRTIRVGDAAIAEAIARTMALPLSTAREAVQACLATGADWSTEIDEVVIEDATEDGAELPVPAEPAAPATPAAAARAVDVSHAAVEKEQIEFLQRLARELVRFLTATGRSGGVRALWITGAGSRLPGVHEMLREVFGCEPAELDVLGRLAHSLPAEEAEMLAPRLAVPVGLALQGFGGTSGFDFRQEDLAFTRGFDRLKFPLAITCMVALFTAVVFAVDRNNQLKNLQYELGATYTGNDDPKNPVFWGMLNKVLQDLWFKEDRHFLHQVGGKDYGYRQFLQDLAAKDVHERIKFVRDKLRVVLEQKQRESGIHEEVSLESGLAVVAKLFDVMKRAESGMGKYVMTQLDLNMRATGSGERSGRFVSFRVAFRGEDFRHRKVALQDAINEECRREGSPFLQLDGEPRETLFSRPQGEPEVSGAFFDFKIIVREAFDPFQEVRQ